MKRIIDNLSDKEIKLFTALGYAYLFENESLLVPTLYVVAARDCFLENKQGKAVDSLRRACYAVVHRTVRRRTEEFDALIDLDEENSNDKANS